jgi:hypothetical protein
MIKLDYDTMEGYLLSVIGSDQIHDFCDIDRLSSTKNLPKIVGGKRLQSGGKQYCVDIPDVDELTNIQCLEIFHIFLNTILNDGTIYTTIKIDEQLSSPSSMPSYNQTTSINKSDEQLSSPSSMPSYNQTTSINKSDEQLSSPSSMPSYNQTTSINKSDEPLSTPSSIPSYKQTASINKLSDTQLKNNKGSSDEYGSLLNVSNSFSQLSNSINSLNTQPNMEYNSWSDNYSTWFLNIENKCNAFINSTYLNVISCELINICVNDIINIYEMFLDTYNKYPNNTTEPYYDDNGSIDLMHTSNKDDYRLHVFYNFNEVSKKYFNNNNKYDDYKVTYNNVLQSGGYPGEYTLHKKMLGKFIQQMAFNFCDIKVSDCCSTVKWQEWQETKSDDNPKQFCSQKWSFFEKSLLLHGINKIEENSTEWVKEQIENKESSSHNLLNIQNLSKIKDNNQLDCNYKTKLITSESSHIPDKHIINNAASEISQFWNKLVLNTYPGFIDSQPTGGKTISDVDELCNYNCGFECIQPSNKKVSYSINLIPQNKNNVNGVHTITIKYGNNDFISKKSYTDFNCDRWKKVTAVESLIHAFDNIYSKKKSFSWNELIVKTKNKDFIKSFYEYSLFKGLGDISQEMTSLFKWGGSVSPHNITYTENDNNIVKWDIKTGNAYRFFLANDRLSANRFILTLNYGLQNKTNPINVLAYGGYFNKFGCKSSNFYLVEATQESIPIVEQVSNSKKRMRETKIEIRNAKEQEVRTAEEAEKAIQIAKRAAEEAEKASQIAKRAAEESEKAQETQYDEDEDEFTLAPENLEQAKKIEKEMQLRKKMRMETGGNKKHKTKKIIKKHKTRKIIKKHKTRKIIKKHKTRKIIKKHKNNK